MVTIPVIDPWHPGAAVPERCGREVVPCWQVGVRYLLRGVGFTRRYWVRQLSFNRGGPTHGTRLVKPYVSADLPRKQRGLQVENVIPEEEPALVDLTQVSLRQLSILGDSALGSSLRWLLAEADNPSEAIAGFQSSVSPKD